MSTSLKVRGIGASKHKFAEFTTLSLYFSGKSDSGQLVYGTLNCKIHLVEGLWVNLLIGNNILLPAGVVVNISKKSALIGSCGVTISVKTKQRGQFLTKKLLVGQETIVPPRSEAMVSFHGVSLPDDRNFFSHPTIQANLTLYNHIVDHETSKILVKNPSDRSVCIL